MKPRLGILGPFTGANVRFAKEEGFTNMILGATRGSTLDANRVNEAHLETVKQTLARHKMNVSAPYIAVGFWTSSKRSP